jgi:uncharacterized protein YkwD
MLRLAVLIGIVICCRAGEESLQELEIRMADLINVEREARGLAPLAFSPVLSDVGRAYSETMAEARTVNHALAGPMEKRIGDALPKTCTFGENVSKHTSIDYSLGDLMLSEGHRANLLSNRFTQVGIGIARGDDGFLYITQEFARPCDRQPSKRREDFPQ